ncbi:MULTISPECIES: MetQ/NlpA family ABC transporter substrate-binding protein [unclassified Pantoea]|uniref:MetQ/NlpA family ABC transporter substrate-binding protein n=1 Tax=unclassified Pantoea TaxID=2630326 RepID=UPI0012321A1D|nr:MULTISPECIES: MetQ/NlpA family ABC transporter substrate-binding protein [unclassified Pantoea]KAA5967126.1 MetQ/NlpA family ABC transporter substrate-binding protein [Pantoea sp. M_6]KAA5973924.1 MetQ/NlpA family ABC transporter substrate-binding protein [Pantoea sp. M_8]KAA5987114.1 MetQ/NlpA family ABC transporter substrate-binding protein [Pantoea sp. M_10]KAA6000893.1 MetQ/NlpA family ABC transporter substrate-binding protein [Pantoea sp. M_5]
MTLTNRLRATLGGLLLTLSAVAAADYSGPLKVGTTAAFAPPLETAVAEAKKQGLAVELVEFTDWTAPNVSVENGDIDVNLFQHKPFLENANQSGGFHLVAYAPAIINNIGLYSKKHSAIDQVPEVGTVAIANDPINGARGLLLLQKAGLITLKPGAGLKSTVDDIVSNPKKLKIIEVEAVQLSRSLEEVDLAQGYPHYLRLAKTIDPNHALLFDGLEHPEYVIQFVIREGHQDDPRLAKFVDIYQHSPVVRASLDSFYGKLYQPGWSQ